MKVSPPAKQGEGVCRFVTFEDDADFIRIIKDRNIVFQGRDQGLSHQWVITIDGDTLVVSGGNVKVTR